MHKSKWFFLYSLVAFSIGVFHYCLLVVFAIILILTQNFVVRSQWLSRILWSKRERTSKETNNTNGTNKKSRLRIVLLCKFWYKAEITRSFSLQIVCFGLSEFDGCDKWKNKKNTHFHKIVHIFCRFLLVYIYILAFFLSTPHIEQKIVY